MALRYSIILLASAVISCTSATPLPEGATAPLAPSDPLETPGPFAGNPEELGPYTEGDMLLPPGTFAGIKDAAYRWPQGQIPYVIAEDFSSKELLTIEEAMLTIESVTCIRFRPRSAQDKDHIKIINSDSGCYSFVGKVGGAQNLNLEPKSGCVTKGIVMHELIHAIGFRHEQGRTDRDDYVRIHLENIKPGKEHNFKKYDASQVDFFGVPYDYGSIMHYSSHAFSSNGRATISVLEDTARIGQREKLSAFDVEKIRNMYEC